MYIRKEGLKLMGESCFCFLHWISFSSQRRGYSSQTVFLSWLLKWNSHLKINFINFLSFINTVFKSKKKKQTSHPTCTTGDKNVWDKATGVCTNICAMCKPSAVPGGKTIHPQPFCCSRTISEVMFLNDIVMFNSCRCMLLQLLSPSSLLQFSCFPTPSSDLRASQPSWECSYSQPSHDVWCLLFWYTYVT